MRFTGMKQIVESGELKRFMDPRLAEALGHPFREHVLAECNEGIVSASQIGERIGADVSLFYKHMQKLERLECIERVDTRQRRRGKEHFFRASSTLYFDNESAKRVPRNARDCLLLSHIQATLDESLGAARRGALGESGDEHTSWNPARLDKQGWSEATKVLDRALEQIGTIQAKSAERLAERDELGIPATVAMFGFRTGAPY